MAKLDRRIPDLDASADKPVERTPEARTKPAVLVLGMHRSGTSSLAGALIRLGGGAPAHLMPPTEDNKRGYWESTVLAALNDEILAASGTQWRDWRRFDPIRIDPLAAASFGTRATLALTAEFRDTVLPVVKDPRMCRLMSFWSPVFREIEWSVRAILLLRSPLEVARSLNRRDGIPLSWGGLLWLRHVLDAEAATRDTRRAVLHWDAFLDDRRGALALLGERLGLTWPRWSDAALEEVDTFVSMDLRRQKTDDDDLKLHPAVSELTQETYAVMTALVGDPSNAKLLRKLDHCRARFDDSAAIFDHAMIEAEGVAWRIFEVDAQRGYEGLLNSPREEFASRIAAERSNFANQLASQIAAERSDFANQLASQIAAERSDFANQLNAAREEFASRIAAERSDFANRLSAAKEGFASLIAAERSDLANQLASQIAAERSDLALRVNAAKKETSRFTQARVEDVIAYVAGVYPRKGKDLVTRIRDYWRTPSRVRKQLKVIRASFLFDEEYYLDSNPDVREAGADAALHYLLHGTREGRNPGPFFSTSQYLARNPDVAVSGVNALVHYETRGRRENRKPPSLLA